jgi:mono/diheme cytochrome c family protein
LLQSLTQIYSIVVKFNSLRSKSMASKALIVLIFMVFSVGKTFAAPSGEALFRANCASCHNPLKDATGPALKGAAGRAPSKELLYKWVHNPAATLATDPYYKGLAAKWAPTVMSAFPQLSTADIDAITAYVDSYVPPAPPTTGGATAGATAGSSTDNTFFYFIITALLAMVAFILLQVNKKLHKVAAEKVGYPIKADVPWYKHKLYLAILGVVAFIALGAWMTNGGIKMGRQQNYKPTQPIYYSHKVHAGINQINCQYCHSGAEKGRNAMIPSTNVCMNCHKGINEYTGAEEHPLVSDDGDKINGTTEIKKLYEYAGWDPTKKAYNMNNKGAIAAQPIPWVKIHNLPDHVFFSHATHVKNGKIACQRCHGPIQEMDEVYQFSSLSMGFCINCHRETKVQFAENNYYKIFQKYHDEIKSGKRDGVTVADVGGLECQKCHY